MRPVLALMVFALDLWALGGVLGSTASRSRKLAWTATILFIPIVGALLWLRAAVRPRGIHRGSVAS